MLDEAQMPLTLQAGLWGLLAGSALILGAALAWMASVPRRIIAAVMAFGSGVLISALSFELMEEAFNRGGFDSTSIGFLGGAAVYTAANIYSPIEGRDTASIRAISSLPIPAAGSPSRSLRCWTAFQSPS